MTFDDIEINEDWTFTELHFLKTFYLTYQYHPYLSAMLPSLPAKLIDNYSSKGDLVLDCFAGGGTTIIEALFNERRAWAVDISPLSTLITRVKITPISPLKLEQAIEQFEARITKYWYSRKTLGAGHALYSNVLTKWFTPVQEDMLKVILSGIYRFKNPAIRNFFLVTFSKILKEASKWDSNITKPSLSKSKIPSNAINLFLLNVKKNARINRKFVLAFPKTTDYNLITCDAREMALHLPSKGQVDLIITSPPYTFSHEFIEAQCISILWLQLLNTLDILARNTIGSRERVRGNDSDPEFQNTMLCLSSSLAVKTCRALKKLDESQKNIYAPQTVTYFHDMLKVFKEMRKTLKIGGKACVIIGNPALHGLDIPNAEIFIEQMQALDFKIHDIIRRKVTGKTGLPRKRDPNTGRYFTHDVKKNDRTEYILVMEKY